MSDQPFSVDTNVLTHMVVERTTGRCLGAFGCNFYRPWVFPLYTPSGQTVIQEYAYDHPFHNGVFVGQYPIVSGERRVNFWAAPLRYTNPEYHVFQHIGRVDASEQPLIEPHRTGVRFTLHSVWRDEADVPVIDEVRTVNLFSVAGATICDMTSRKIAAYGAVQYPQTKYGSIGVRVEPRLLPDFGAEIIADNDRRGRADVVHEQESDFVAYERASTAGTSYGIMLSIAGNARGPWFIRDYGMAMYNPTWVQSYASAAGETWEIGLRVVAYDGAMDSARAASLRGMIAD